jgi:hypothetical protein
MTPLFFRTPSVFDEKRLVVMSVYLKTDKYLFFSTFTYNWDEIIALIEKGQQPKLNEDYFAYELHTSRVFSVEKGPSSIKDAPVNTAVRRWFADVLVEDLENGKLDGKLKKIAQTLNEEDNPVVEITKYR